MLHILVPLHWVPLVVDSVRGSSLGHLQMRALILRCGVLCKTRMAWDTVTVHVRDETVTSSGAQAMLEERAPAVYVKDNEK